MRHRPGDARLSRIGHVLPPISHRPRWCRHQCLGLQAFSLGRVRRQNEAKSRASRTTRRFVACASISPRHENNQRVPRESLYSIVLVFLRNIIETRASGHFAKSLLRFHHGRARRVKLLGPYKTPRFKQDRPSSTIQKIEPISREHANSLRRRSRTSETGTRSVFDRKRSHLAGK
jgi:hypothetical protein